MGILRKGGRPWQLQGVRQEGHPVHPNHRLGVEICRVCVPGAILRQGQGNHRPSDQGNHGLSRSGLATAERRRNSLHRKEARSVGQVCPRSRHGRTEAPPHPTHKRIHRESAQSAWP
uniref:(northern house mosquito) hypothetical protein n=1 Tax=Culex pipiens TaxID=7175 RepID=A0A8D8AKP3_CULPI